MSESGVRVLLNFCASDLCKVVRCFAVFTVVLLSFSFVIRSRLRSHNRNHLIWCIRLVWDCKCVASNESLADAVAVNQISISNFYWCQSIEMRFVFGMRHIAPHHFNAGHWHLSFLQRACDSCNFYISMLCRASDTMTFIQFELWVVLPSDRLNVIKLRH